MPAILSIQLPASSNPLAKTNFFKQPCVCLNATRPEAREIQAFPVAFADPSFAQFELSNHPGSPIQRLAPAKFQMHFH